VYVRPSPRTRNPIAERPSSPSSAGRERIDAKPPPPVFVEPANTRTPDSIPKALWDRPPITSSFTTTHESRNVSKSVTSRSPASAQPKAS